VKVCKHCRIMLIGNNFGHLYWLLAYDTVALLWIIVPNFCKGRHQKD